MKKGNYVLILLGIIVIFTACVQNKSVDLSTQDTTASMTISGTEQTEVIEIAEEINIYSDYTLADEFEFDDYCIEIYQCNNEEENYQIDWRNKETDEITSVITGSSLLMVTSAGYVFEEIYGEDDYKVHGYNQGELMLDIIVDGVDLNDKRPMAINPQYRKDEEEIPEEDFRLEMSDVIKLYKFSDYDGIVFGRYVRDFPMDEDVFIDLIEGEMEYLLTSLGIGGTLSLKLVDIDNNGIPELCNYSMHMGARPFYNLECIDYSKGERTQYNVSINGIDTNDLRSLYINSIFKEKNAHGIERFYLDCYYFAKYYSYMGFPSHSCTGIFILELEEEIETGNLSTVWSPVVRKIEYDTIIYEMFDEKTGTLIEINEEEYNKYYEEFKSIGVIDYLNITNDVHYRVTYENDDQFELTKQSIINSGKRTIINMAQKYIHLYKISEYTEPLEIRFDKQKFIDNMEKATEDIIFKMLESPDYIILEDAPSLLYLTDINTDGMPELVISYPESSIDRYDMFDIASNENEVKHMAYGYGLSACKHYIDIILEKPVCIQTTKYTDFHSQNIVEDIYEMTENGGIYKIVCRIITEIDEDGNEAKSYLISDTLNLLMSNEIEYHEEVENYYSTLHEISLPYAEAKYEEVKYSEDEFRKVFAELTDAYIESCEIIAETHDEWLVFDIVND